MKRMPPLLPSSVAAFLAIPAAFAAPASSPAADKATVRAGGWTRSGCSPPDGGPKALVVYFSDRSRLAAERRRGGRGIASMTAMPCSPSTLPATAKPWMRTTANVSMLSAK